MNPTTTTTKAASVCPRSGEIVAESDTDTWSHVRCDCGADAPTTSMGDDPRVAGWRFIDEHQTPEQAAASRGDE